MGLLVEHFAQGVEQRRANIAGHGHRFAGTLNQLARERGHGGFAVRAGDADDLGRIRPVFFQVSQRLREQAELVAAGNPLRLSRRDNPADGGWRQTRTFQHQVKSRARQQRRVHGGMHKDGGWHAGLQTCQLRRHRPCVSYRDVRTAAAAPACQRQT